MAEREEDGFEEAEEGAPAAAGRPPGDAKGAAALLSSLRADVRRLGGALAQGWTTALKLRPGGAQRRARRSAATGASPGLPVASRRPRAPAQAPRPTRATPARRGGGSAAAPRRARGGAAAGGRARGVRGRPRPFPPTLPPPATPRPPLRHAAPAGWGGATAAAAAPLPQCVPPTPNSRRPFSRAPSSSSAHSQVLRFLGLTEKTRARACDDAARLLAASPPPLRVSPRLTVTSLGAPPAPASAPTRAPPGDGRPRRAFARPPSATPLPFSSSTRQSQHITRFISRRRLQARWTRGPGTATRGACTRRGTAACGAPPAAPPARPSPPPSPPTRCCCGRCSGWRGW